MYTLEASQVIKQIEQDKIIPTTNIAQKRDNSTQKFIIETERLDQQGTYDKLNSYFSEQDQEHKKIFEARSILAESGENLTDEQVANLISNAQYLVDIWLEEFERTVFEGKTLLEIFNLGRL